MGRCNFYYNLIKMECSKHLKTITYDPYDFNEEDVIEEYREDFNRVKLEQKWSEDDIVIFPDESSPIVLILQCPKKYQVFASIGGTNCRFDFLLYDVESDSIFKTLSMKDFAECS